MKIINKIKKEYSEQSKYRIIEGIYQPGEKFVLVARKIKLFLINGSCSFISKDNEVFNFTKGDVVEVSAGEYKFSCDKNTGVHYVAICDIEGLAEKREPEMKKFD